VQARLLQDRCAIQMRRGMTAFRVPDHRSSAYDLAPEGRAFAHMNRLIARALARAIETEVSS
jgi:hypothetical protein